MRRGERERESAAVAARRIVKGEALRADLNLIMRREKEATRPQLCQNAPHAPEVDRVAPLEAERHLGRAVLPRAHDGRVMVLVPRGTAEVDERDLGEAG